jgi:hypothetical protein
MEAVRDKAREHGYSFYAISSATGAGIEELRFGISDVVFETKPDVTIAIGS